MDRKLLFQMYFCRIHLRQLANVEMSFISNGILFYKNPIKDHKNVKNMAEKNLTYSILGQDVFLFWSE